MRRLPRSVGVASLFAAAAVGACSSAVQQSAHTSVQTGAPARPITPAEQARADRLSEALLDMKAELGELSAEIKRLLAA